ncbi:hypothetical protein [Calidifontibacter indicus]|uniref:Uncharacterized protein n=1 Tax=Calidifontibacter indicus TaxID=419650 RepID=A0A3D9UMS9_9MICO|nr:hypothetical protein [Calidifontibacter indicus]REF30768.1 hypothetical protein DFJ65_1788 [Calidifontibacter indicus]
MTSLAKSIKQHRETARARRAFSKAIENAGTPASRDDLIMAWQRSGF